MTMSFARITSLAAATLLAAAPLAAQDYDGLAASLAKEPKAPECENKLPDGTCPDVVDTRQIVMGGGRKAANAGAAAARAVTRSVRQNISMTFESGSSQLTASARASLDRFAKALVAVGTYRPFEIEGHTDRVGSRELNQKLSQARAQSVAAYLAEKGVDQSRVTARGYGYDRPLSGVSPNSPRNRRVEVSAR